MWNDNDIETGSKKITNTIHEANLVQEVNTGGKVVRKITDQDVEVMQEIC